MSLLMLKSVLTTLVLLLAMGQAISGMRLRGRFRWLPIPIPAKALRLWHRLVGDVTLLLILIVAIICVTHLPFSTYSLRVPLHALLGTLAAVVLFIKVVVARRFRRFLRHASVFGSLAGFSLLGCFAASALWYFFLIW
jgi:hypothetical protein